MDVEAGGLLQVAQTQSDDPLIADIFNADCVEQVLQIANDFGKTIIEQVEKNPTQRDFRKLFKVDAKWLKDKVGEVMQGKCLKDHVAKVKRKIVYHLLSLAMKIPAVNNAVMTWAPDAVCKLAAYFTGSPALLQTPRVLAEDVVFQQVQARLKVNTSRDPDETFFQDIVKPEHLEQVLHIAAEAGKTIKDQCHQKPGKETFRKMMNTDTGFIKDQVDKVIQKGWLKDGIELAKNPAQAAAVITTKLLVKAVSDPALRGGVWDVLLDNAPEIIERGGWQVGLCLGTSAVNGLINFFR